MSTMTPLTSHQTMHHFSLPEDPITNHQGYAVAFHRDLQGRVTCDYSKQGVFLGKDIPLLIPPDHPALLTRYTITYVPEKRSFIWVDTGLRGGMNPSKTTIKGSAKSTGSGTQNFGEMTFEGDYNTGPITQYRLSPEEIQQVEERKKYQPLLENPMGNLPFDLGDFAGRGVLLADLAELLIPKSFDPTKASSLAILQGPPGIGKSQTALRFANQNSKHFCKIYFLHAETSLEADYRGLAKELCVSLEEKESLIAVQEKVHRTLSNLSSYARKPYLLIFDNVEEPFTLELRGGSLLLTSRSKDIHPDRNALREVSPFGLEDVESLYRMIFKADPPAELTELHQEAEGFPLLIRALFLCADNPKEFRVIFEEDKKQLKRHTDPRYQGKLGDVFEAVLKKFAQKHPEAFDLLQIVSFLNPDGVSLDLVDFYGASQGYTPEKTRSFTKALITSSLACYTDDQEGLAIHRITQDLCKTPEGYSRALCLLSTYSQKFDPDDLCDRKQVKERFFPHFSVLKKDSLWEKGDFEHKWNLLIAMSSNCSDSREDGRKDSLQEKREFGLKWNLLIAMSSGCSDSREYGRTDQEISLGISFAEEALHLALGRGKGGDSFVAASYSRMGSSMMSSCLMDKVLGSTGSSLKYNYTADEPLVYQNKALELYKGLWGEKHLDVAKSYREMGMSLYGFRRYSEALEYLEKALVLYKELLGEKHLSVARICEDLAHIWGSGAPDEALEYQKNALEIYTLAKKPLDIAESYQKIGDTLSILKQYIEALEYRKKALGLYKELWEGGVNEVTDSDVVRSQLQLGDTLSALGRHEEALEYKRQALKLWEDNRFSFLNHPLESLATTLDALGRHAEASEHRNEAERIIANSSCIIQ